MWILYSLIVCDYKLIISEVKEMQRLRESGESLSSKQYRRSKRHGLLNIEQDDKLMDILITRILNLYMSTSVVRESYINTGHKRDKG